MEKKGIRPQHICNLNSVIKSLELATSHKPPSKKTTAPLPISWENLYCFFRFSRREWGNNFLKFILEAAINYGESRARPKTLAGLKGWQDPPKIPNTKQSGDNKHKLCNGKCPKILQWPKGWGGAVKYFLCEKRRIPPANDILTTPPVKKQLMNAPGMSKNSSNNNIKHHKMR